jgi:hypothetical protein
MWQGAQDSILTKDNMKSRKWQGDQGCYFCGEDESASHLLFTCPSGKSGVGSNHSMSVSTDYANFLWSVLGVDPFSFAWG